MNVIAFDLKTIPDIEGGRRLYHLHGLSDKDVANVMFHKRRQEGGESEALRLHLQRVVAISLIHRDGESFSLSSFAAPEVSEPQLLDKLFASFEGAVPTLVSWNGNAFAIPILNYRALVHGIPAGPFWQALNGRHIDLSEALAAHRGDAHVPLGEIASLLGLPGRSEGTGGNQAWDRYLAGDFASLNQACEIDALNSYLVYLRFQLIRGQLDQSAYEQECQQVRTAVQFADKAHLHEFLAAWPEQA